MKRVYEQLFKEIRRADEFDIVSSMQVFVLRVLKDGEIEVLFEASDRFDPSDVDRQTFLEIIIDIALEQQRFDLARKTATRLDGVTSSAFGFARIAKVTKDQDDVHLARNAAMTMDNTNDILPRAVAFIEVFSLSGLNSDRVEAERIALSLQELGFPSLAHSIFVAVAHLTKSLADYLRCIRCLDECERLKQASSQGIEELLEPLLGRDQEEIVDQLLAQVEHQKLHRKIQLFLRKRRVAIN